MSPDQKTSPLQSPALGSDLDGLIRPCGDPMRPARPESPAQGKPIGVTFSGGGFRATFPAAGVVRYLADAGLLQNLRYSSSVSGGSVANGMLATRWPAIRRDGYSPEAVDREVIAPLTERVTAASLKTKLIRNVWRATFSKTRTDVLAWAFDDWFFDEIRLHELDPEVRWIFNAANLTTGVRFGYERDVLGDYVTGLAATADTDVPVSLAVATSAAVPGAFAPVKLKDVEFPCRHGRDIQLLDGGTYDNTGIEAIDSERYRDVFTISLGAGGVLVTGAYGKVPIVRDLSRASSLLYRQSRVLRTRAMVARFIAARGTPIDEPPPPGARRGLLFGLATTVKPDPPTPEYKDFVATYPEVRDYDGKDLAFVPTVFDKLAPELVRRLVYRGWWLTGATMALYYPQLAPLPAGTEPPPVA
jgi:NTE family protein